MKAYRIQNDIVAAWHPAAAIEAWADELDRSITEAGPVEEVDPETLEISIQDEPDGPYRPGKLAEVMPLNGPACVVCVGECGCE